MPIYIPPLVKKIGVGTIPTGLNDLSDVIVSAPTSGQGLIYNGSYWLNGDIATQVELNNLASSTAAATGSLQTQISSNDNDISNLQIQINEITTGINIVFCEQFTGDGIATTAQLDGSITNGQFISGGWSAIEVANTLPAYITDLNGKPIYNSSNIFTRTRITVSTINSSGLVTLNYAPLNLQSYKIWYFYSLSADDRLDNYYRDDFVAGMEEEISSTVIGSQVQLNTAAFNGILNGTHTTAQAAFDKIDDIDVVAGANITVVESPAGVWTVSTSGGSGFTPLEGTGINIAASGADYVFSVDDYISKTEVTALSGNFVPYTGAISDVNLGNNKLLVDAIQLDLTPVASPASTKGQISWNIAEGTTNIGLGDVTLQVGLEDLNLVYNNEGSTIYNGQLVYINGGNNAGNPTVKLARADQEAGSSVFGMATQDISAGGVGYVTSRGKVRDLDTSSFAAGQVLYLSDTVWGGWTAETSGYALSSHRNKIGYVGLSDISAGYVFIDIDNESIDTQISRTEEVIAAGLSLSTGVYDYSGMTIATSASFTVPPLKGWVIENTGAYNISPLMTNVVFTGGTYPVTNILTDIATYVMISKTGVISQQVTYPTPEQRRDNIYLGKIAHTNKTSIGIINNTTDYSVSPFSALRDMFTPIAILNEGVTPYPDGANLSFNKSAGSLYGLGINWTVNNKSPNKVTFTGSTPVTFSLFTQTAPDTLNTTLIQPGYYDNAGVKTAIPTSGDGGANRSTNFRIYQFITGVVVVQYGQTYYSSLANAVAAGQTESFTRYPSIPGAAVLIGILSVRRSATVLNNTAYAVFTPASIFGEVTGGTVGISTTTLQQAYDNSTTPEIVTNSILDGVTLRRGSASDSDIVLHVQSGIGENVFTVTGLGEVTTASISGNADNLVAHDINGKLIDSGAKISDYTLLSTTESITANFQAQINGKANTAHTHTSLDITDFNEAVYDNVATDGMIVAGSNISLSYDDINNQLTISAAVDVSASGLMNGAYDCDTTNIVYTITHPSVDTNYSVPTTSLLIPTSGSNIFVQGISNRQNTSFDVTLSEVPNISGYKILWHLPVTAPSVIGTAVVNQQMTTLPSITTSVSGNYTVAFDDTVVYADNNNTILLPASPSTNEHHWIVNTYGADITVDGNGKFIWIVGANNATAILPQDSSIHLHYNATKDKWYII